jgi:glutathione S-transferase
VKWTADLLGLPYTWVPTDVVKGETRTPEYLSKFPQGQVPAVEFDDGRTLAQSNAIIRYLARDSELLPDEGFAQAKIDEWLFWEQYSHEPYIAVCRFHMAYLGRSFDEREVWRVERGEKALDFIERHFDGHDYLAGSSITIADIAVLAYTRVAHEGGFDLAERPGIRKWIARCESSLRIH